MSNLAEYARLPEVKVNGKKYVDEELLIGIFEKRFADAKKDCESEEERNGIDMCRNILANWIMKA